MKRPGRRIALTASGDGADAPLSFAQQRLWFLDRLTPGEASYNLDVVLRLRGALDAEALGRALREIVARHDVLRTAFPLGTDGAPRQRVRAELPLGLDVVDLASLPPAAASTAAWALVREWCAEPFDLRAGPLVRASLVRVGDDEHLLALVMHHAVCDGWSVDVLLRELGCLYAPGGEPTPPPAPAVRYADYARWQRELLSSERMAGEQRWWAGYLDGAPTTLGLAPGAARGTGGARVAADLPGAVSDGVAALARAESATPFPVLLAAYALLLAGRTGRRELLVGTQVAGRPRPELLDAVGLFVNTIPIRVDLTGARTFRALAAAVRDSVLDALTHDRVPLDHIVAAVPADRSAGPPLVQTAFIAPAAPPYPPALAGLDAELVELPVTSSKFDLSLAVAPTAAGGHEAALTYDTGVLPAAEARAIVHGYRDLLAAAVADPDAELWPAPGPSLTGSAPPPADSLAPDGPPRDLPPRAALEELVHGVWRDVLGDERVGRHDNFFDAGGQSLTLAVVHARVERELGRELPLLAFYEHPTVTALAAHLAGSEAAPARAGARRAPRDRRRAVPGGRE